MPPPSKPLVSFWQIWNMCFGFLGVQFAFGLQNANVSRIFQSLGASLPGAAVVDCRAIEWPAGAAGHRLHVRPHVDAPRQAQALLSGPSHPGLGRADSHAALANTVVCRSDAVVAGWFDQYLHGAVPGAGGRSTRPPA